jgi:hypothetical protein
MDVGSWLRSLGLAQYEASFRDNEIEAEVLADLTETDLEKLGLPLGPSWWIWNGGRSSMCCRTAQPPEQQSG